MLEYEFSRVNVDIDSDENIYSTELKGSIVNNKFSSKSSADKESISEERKELIKEVINQYAEINISKISYMRMIELSFYRR